MSTNNPSTNPTSSSSPKPDNSKQRIVAIAAAFIVVLLIVNGILLFNKFRQDRVKKDLTEQLDESEQLKAELEKQYYEALSELENMRGSNEELNALIEKQKEELTGQKDRIDKLIRNGRDLDKARKELANLRSQVEQYVAEINQLRAENQELASMNTQLSVERDSLSTNLTNQIQTNEQLSTAQAALVSEKEMLEQDKAALAKKVTKASAIKVSSVEVTGIRIRSNGKEVKERNAENVNKLQICFTTSVNNVTEPGMETFYIRIINPLGETLALESMGSGVLTNSETGEQVRYTQIAETRYDRESGSVCLNWEPNQPFQSGNYEVEVFNKSYLVGTGSFQLK